MSSVSSTREAYRWSWVGAERSGSATAAMKPSRWEGCYDQQWAGVITPASMAHPAKFSRGLIEHIYRHCLERGYLHKGDVVGDAFAGVGCGGIMAAYAGLRWVGVELEERFTQMALQNFRLHERKWRLLGLPLPVIMRGDSRQFDKLVGQACGIVASPPFATQQTGAGLAKPEARYKDGTKIGCNCGYQNQGDSPGQIGKLPAGEVAGVISSPPYAEGGGHKTGQSERDIEHGKGIYTPCDNYGDSPGQIGRLKGGELAACVTSPPYESSLRGQQDGIDWEKAKQNGELGQGHWKGKSCNADYGATPGQIAAGAGETYWQAVRDVYAACHRVIKPGGVLVLVTKDYVKQRKRVPLSDDTVTLCESLGFTLIERIQAMLVSETRHPDLFNGVDVKTKSRKSFFRRLAESKGSPRIDHEDVLIFRR